MVVHPVWNPVLLTPLPELSAATRGAPGTALCSDPTSRLIPAAARLEIGSLRGSPSSHCFRPTDSPDRRESRSPQSVSGGCPCDSFPLRKVQGGPDGHGGDGAAGQEGGGDGGRDTSALLAPEATASDGARITHVTRPELARLLARELREMLADHPLLAEAARRAGSEVHQKNGAWSALRADLARTLDDDPARLDTLCSPVRARAA